MYFYICITLQHTKNMNITIDIPKGKELEVSKYVEKIGGRVVTQKQLIESKETEAIDKDDEVTHEVFFGENIKRLIKAFSW